MSAKDAIAKREAAKRPKPVVRKAKPVEVPVEPTAPVEHVETVEVFETPVEPVSEVVE